MTDDSTKILFVDDDPATIDALKRLLANEGWNCHFASSASEVLQQIETEPMALLVSNVELPGMDGTELLAEISNKHPQTVRLLLTDVAKDEKTLKALAAGHAQQIIPVPWIDQELKEVIRSALRQSTQQKKHSLKFQALINSMPLLPALPESYSQVQNCIMDNDVDIEKMADIIGQDVGMSSALLHWANSALFGQRFRVDTIKKAIVVLGTDIVVNLILSEAVTRSMTSTPLQTESFNLKTFKSHSIATAIIARMLIKSTFSSNSDMQDRAFIAGLLHDMGKLVAASNLGRQYSAASRLANHQHCTLHDAEMRILGTSHAELGSFLAEWWALPHFIVSTIAAHHEPRISPVDPEVINAVYLANLLSYRFGFGCNGEKRERDIDQQVWDKFFLTEESLEILDNETAAIMKVFCSQQ